MTNIVQTEASEQTGRIKQRQSNFELLRIVAMLMIIAHHFAVHSEFSYAFADLSLSRLWVLLIQLGGKVGVNVFVLISGYFLILAPTLRTGKVLKLWLQIFTYSVVFLGCSFLTGTHLGARGIVRCLLPITGSQWWFASTYFVFYLLSPYVGKLLRSLDKGDYQRLLVLLTVCWCLIPTFTTKGYQSNDLLWFFYLFAVAGYIRLHAGKTKITGRTYLLGAAVVWLCTFLSAVMLSIAGTKVAFLEDRATYFYGTQKLPVLLIALFLFLGFYKIDIGSRKAINLLSSATFGVYLIHDSGILSPLIWEKLFHGTSLAESLWLIPYSLAAIAAVWIGTSLIELARIYLLERHYRKSVEKLAAYIDRKKDQFFSMKLFQKL